MRKTKEVSWTLLATMLVLVLVEMQTGWAGAVAAWVGGHIIDLIPDSAERTP